MMEETQNETPPEAPTSPQAQSSRRYSLSFPVLLAVVGISTLYLASQLPVFIQRGQRLPGPQYFPTILGVFFCIAALVEAARYLACRRRRQAAAQAGGEAVNGCGGSGVSSSRRFHSFVRDWGNQSVAVLLVALLVFVTLLPRLGFVLSGFLFALVMLLRLKARPVKALVLAAVLVVVIAFIFVSVFRVPLPRGILSLPL